MIPAAPQTLRHVPFRLLGGNEIHLRYLEEDAELQPFIGVRARDAQDLLRKAPLNARRLVPANALAAALRAYAERHAAPPAVFASCDAIEAGAQVVVTGQQPGLFGGPLYTLHKAATAVRLAHDLTARGNGRFVPVFWNHTDDHDLDEVNRAFFVNANQDVQRLRLDLTRGGEPIRDIGVGQALEKALAAVADLLPGSEFRERALALFTPRHADEHLGDGLARLLFALLGDAGLVVIEPRDLPAPAFDVLGRWWEQAGAVQRTIRTASEDLLDVGIDAALDPAATLMFQHTGGRRVPLADGDDLPRVQSLSPGALLRPLWQDACLPTVAFVVGPGELSYLAVAGPLYRQLGVPAPVLVPRASLTLVEPSLARLLKRFGWDLPDLARGPETLARSVASPGDGAEDDVEALAEHIKAQAAALAAKLRDADKEMLGPLDRVRHKMLDELDKFGSKLRNARQNREGTGLRQIRRLCSNLWPRERLQERVLTPLPFVVAHGEELGRTLVAAADPFAMSHGVLEL